MTVQEYAKVFDSLDAESKEILHILLSNQKDRLSGHDIVVANKMYDAITGNVPRHIPCKTEFELDDVRGVLKIRIRSDNPEDVLALKQKFLNDHLISGEWPLMKHLTTPDGIWTEYIAKRNGPARNKESKEEKAMRENPMGYMMSLVEQLPPDQRRAALAQLQGK